MNRLLALLGLVVILALALTLTAGGAPIAAQQASVVQPSPFVPRVSLRSNPVMFIENAGQWDERARFQVCGGTSAGTMWLAEDAIWLTIVEHPAADVARSAG